MEYSEVLKSQLFLMPTTSLARKTEQNPWTIIYSIYDLQYFNCPTCQFKNQSKSIDKITKAVLDIIQDKFLDLPQCHMKIITRRVIKGRVHFWSSFKNDEKQIINQEDIQGASCASKSTRAKTALK